MKKLRPDLTPEDNADMPIEPTDFESGLGEDDLIDLRIWLRLLTCTNLIERRIRKNLGKKFDTTLPRFDVLAQLDRTSDGQPMRELSKRLMVTKGNITSLVDRLEEDGLVDRQTSPRDRRVQNIQLTKNGQTAVTKMIPEHNAWLTDIMAGLDRNAAMDLHALLGELKKSILLNQDEDI